ncbi:MAG: hypothetical protein AAFX06_09750 [Planctomycetota bacterium]
MTQLQIFVLSATEISPAGAEYLKWRLPNTIVQSKAVSAYESADSTER